MVLADSFYYQPVQIDTINTRVNADLFAKEGDANGRGMVVQITENGSIKDTTGITLRLQWSHVTVGVSGFTDFEVVDATKGLYKLVYPTSMLHRGRVEAFIRITDNGILSGTRNLLITVERMVGSDETIEASDDFSALQTALTRLSILEEAIIGKVDTWESDMEDTKQLYIDTLAAAEAAYPQELVSLQGQLADKAQQHTTVATMKLSNNLKVGDVVKTSGYYASGDGGGAKYTIESSRRNVFRYGEPTDYFKVWTGGTVIGDDNYESRIGLTLEDKKLIINSYDNNGWWWVGRFINLDKNTVYEISADAHETINILGVANDKANTIGTKLVELSNTESSETFNSGNFDHYLIAFFPNAANKYFDNVKIKETVDYEKESHVLNNGLFANLLEDGEINVKQFGAKGDFKQDDTVYIQRAFTYLDKSEISFPSGIYLTTSTLYINNDSSLKLSSGAVIKAHAPMDYLLVYNKYTKTKKYRLSSGVCIQGGVFDGNFKVKNVLGLGSYLGLHLDGFRLHNFNEKGIVTRYGGANNGIFNAADGAVPANELTVSNISIRNNKSVFGTIGIYNNARDGIFENIIIRDTEIGVWTLDGLFTQVHGWIGLAELLPDSYFIISEDGYAILDSCYSDTYRYSFASRCGPLAIKNCQVLFNVGIYSQTLATTYPPVIFKLEDTVFYSETTPELKGYVLASGNIIHTYLAGVKILNRISEFNMISDNHYLIHTSPTWGKGSFDYTNLTDYYVAKK